MQRCGEQPSKPKRTLAVGGWVRTSCSSASRRRNAYSPWVQQSWPLLSVSVLVLLSRLKVDAPACDRRLALLWI